MLKRRWLADIQFLLCINSSVHDDFLLHQYLLNGDTLGQIPRLVHVGAAPDGGVVGQQLQGDNR